MLLNLVHFILKAAGLATLFSAATLLPHDTKASESSPGKGEQAAQEEPILRLGQDHNDVLHNSKETANTAAVEAVVAEDVLRFVRRSLSQLSGVDLATIDFGRAQGALAVVVTGAADLPVDCDLNGIDDRVEIANGTAPDANGNGVPDHCEEPHPGPAGGLPVTGPYADGRWVDRVAQEVLLLLENGELHRATEQNRKLQLAWTDSRSVTYGELEIVAIGSSSLTLVGYGVTQELLLGHTRSRRIIATVTLR